MNPKVYKLLKYEVIIPEIKDFNIIYLEIISLEIYKFRNLMCTRKKFHISRIRNSTNK